MKQTYSYRLELHNEHLQFTTQNRLKINRMDIILFIIIKRYYMITFFVILSLVITATVAISFYTYLECFHSPAVRNDDLYTLPKGSQYEAVKDNMFAITRIMEKTQWELVKIASFDGLRLNARYSHTKDGAPVQILFHGYRSIAMRDCAGGFMLAKKMGFNVLVVDQRAHAKSSGRVITFGICERKDCVSWAEYVMNRFSSDIPIILSGLSMGAATVLMASELKLPNNVVAIMADCPYCAPEAIIHKVCRDRHIPATLACPFIRLGARLFGKFKLRQCNAENAVKKATVPILLIHGEDDRFVPCEMSKRIFAACAPYAELHTFPGAGHGLCYMTDPLRYEMIVTKFLFGIPKLRHHMSQNEYVRKELRGEIRY